jgi:hypothetical protein
MGVDISGIGQGLSAIDSIIGKFFPDKTEVEKAQIAGAMSALQGQLSIDQAEAQSNDPLQHWRGGMGWVCVMGYFHNFIFQPLVNDVVVLLGRHGSLPALDIGPLSALTMGMLGLGALHVTGQINGVK